MHLTALVGAVRSFKLRTTGTKKLVLVMKLTTLIILAACLSAAAKTNGQTVTLDLKEAPVQRVFTEVIRQTGISIIYNEALFKNASPVTIRVKDATVQQVLDKCLAGQPFSYKIEGTTIVITKLSQVSGLVTTEPVVIPPITVKGRVVSSDGSPIEAASILISGTTLGTTTDAAGYFTLSNVPENATLLISGVSIEGTVQVKVNGRTDVGDIITVKKVIEGQEILINAGYYKVKPKDKTGSISRVDAKTISKQPVSNTLQALQGRMTGVVIEQTTGVPGGSFDIRIRGQNSLRAGGTTGLDGNLPLYVIDGVPYTSTALGSSLGGSIVRGGNPLSSLNPSDIESVEILKDADATSIYGSRGSNGVVLITTKKGKAGKIQIDVTQNNGFGKVSSRMELLSTSQYLAMRNEALNNDARVAAASDYDVNGTWDKTRETDWQEELIGGTAAFSNTHASVYGGNKAIRFLVGAGYYRETTVFPGDFNYNKGSTNFSLTHTSPNNKFNLLFSGNYSIEKNNLLPTDLTSTAITMAPNSPAIYDNAGKLNWQGGSFNNPYSTVLRDFNTRTSNLIGNATIGYELFKGFTLKSSFGFTETQLKERSKVPLVTLNPSGTTTTASSIFGDKRVNSWIIEPQINYETVLGPGRINILLGSTFQENKLEAQRLTGTGYTSDVLLDNPQAAPTLILSDFSTVEYKYSAVFGRINYDLRNKYIINITGRRDGSSRFGPGRQFANFGAVGTSWIFSKEKFVQKAMPFLSFGKLRASYGTTGSDQIPDYGFFELWNSLTTQYNGTTGITPANLFNPDFSWEINRKLEFGIELGILKNRISLEAGYYRNRSGNQLIGLPLPSTTGFNSIQSNFSALVQNTGFELELRTENIKGKSFTWSTELNITVPRNKLVEFENIENSSFNNDYKVGKSLGVKYTYHYIGLDPSTGMYMFEDLSKDGRVTVSADKSFFKEISKEYYGGLLNSISYKGFQLDVFFQFVKQTGYNYIAYFGSPGTFSNQPTYILDHWRKPGDVSTIQRYSQTGTGRAAYVNAQASDYAIGDASFIRLKNLWLGYNFPDLLLKKFKVNNLRVFIQGQNLLTITNYKGLDPENQRLSLPPLRVLTVGAQVNL